MYLQDVTGYFFTVVLSRIKVGSRVGEMEKGEQKMGIRKRTCANLVPVQTGSIQKRCPMKLENLNAWDLTPAEAVQVQKELTEKVRGGKFSHPRTVLGLDVSYNRTDRTSMGSAVLLDTRSLIPLDSWSLRARILFPYVPGLLSFREIPSLLPILEEVPQPDLIIVDGHGIAHPRGLGLASHIGLITGTPTIGCAKSLLAGQCQDPSPEPGYYTPIFLQGVVVGYALRSRKGCKPLFISPGHLLDPEEARRGVEMCLKGYRLPEPTRLADKLSKGKGDV
jgi:deoxyribonuclease V